MTESLRESISALMDNEASELETRRILSEIQKNDELRNTWKRYHIASLVGQRKLEGTPDLDVSKCVSQAIANEQIDAEATDIQRTYGSKTLRAVTSVAVAASVAFLVVFGTLQINQSDDDGSPALAQQGQNSTSAVLMRNVANADNSMIVSEQALSPDQKRLRELMDAHTQQAAISRSRGFMPHAQLVSAEKKRQH